MSGMAPINRKIENFNSQSAKFSASEILILKVHELNSHKETTVQVSNI